MPLTTDITFNGQRLRLDASGALFWPDEKLLIVSDLHLEKASFLAQFGSPLPRYDTRDTLSKIAKLITVYQPEQIVCLGDSFHDAKAFTRLEHDDRNALYSLITSVPRWQWILGNHDPELPSDLPGLTAKQLQIRGISLLHEPAEQKNPHIIGHFHPKLRRSINGARVTGKVFAHNDNLLLMPAFGSYTGGLDVEDPALAPHLVSARYYLLYRDQIWKV